MPVVTETLELPDGTTPLRVTVVYELAGTAGARVEGFDLTGNVTIIGGVSPPIGANGDTTVTLTGNAAITPSGTLWRRTVSGPGFLWVDHLDVPTTGGPYRVEDILSPAPSAVSPAELSHLLRVRTLDAHGNIGSTETLDAAQGDIHTATLGANLTATLGAPADGRPGVMTVRYRQDVTGGRTLSHATTVVWPGGQIPVLSTAANAVDTIVYLFDGAGWSGYPVGFNQS